MRGEARSGLGKAPKVPGSVERANRSRLGEVIEELNTGLPHVGSSKTSEAKIRGKALERYDEIRGM